MSMKINQVSFETAADIEEYVETRPQEVQDKGLDSEVIDIGYYGNLDSAVIGTFEQTNMSYVNIDTALEDGLSHAKLKGIKVRETSVFFCNPGTFGISVFDPTIDAYPYFKSIFSGLGVEPSKSGNDFLLNGKKVMGVANYTTDGWTAVSQLDPLNIKASKYVDLPDSKWEGKQHDKPEDRITSLNEIFDTTITIDDIKEQLVSVFGDM